MGWIYNNDAYTEAPIKFDTLNDSIDFCLKHGISYEVEYPNKRYHTKKDYADNFKYKGNHIEELEEY